MGFEDLSNTNLVLGLGFSISSTEQQHNNNSTTKIKPTQKMIFEPSLTLSLSGEPHDDQINRTVKKMESFENNKVDHDQLMLYRQDSAGASSFSNVSVKREREMGSEEVEYLERVNSSSRVISTDHELDDDDGSNARKKLRLTKAQSALLEESFKHHSTLNPKQKQDLARDLKLRPRQVEVWFQNRRARTKLKQTEVDCEFLKKCCETLTDENRRLQKELQDLKALKLAQPLYMQLPAATLTMCPSCEKIGGGVENAAKSAFTLAPKSHFYNRCTNPSAAC